MLCAILSRSVVRLFVTPRTVVLQTPLSMGILQARILAWVAMPSSRGSSQRRDRTRLLNCRRILYHLSLVSPRIQLKGEIWTQRVYRKMACEDGDRDYGGASTSQGTQRLSPNHCK